MIRISINVPKELTLDNNIIIFNTTTLNHLFLLYLLLFLNFRNKNTRPIKKQKPPIIRYAIDTKVFFDPKTLEVDKIRDFFDPN